MKKDKATVPADNPSQAFNAQTTCNPTAKLYTARCAVCGSEQHQKHCALRSLRGTINALRLHFNYCGECGRWVCGDCFIMDDAVNGGIGICTECAKKQGVKGYTSAQFNTVWPVVKKLGRRKQREGGADEKMQR